VPIYNFNRLRRSGRTCYLGPKPKSGAPGNLVINPIEVGTDDEEE
jgi:hypothetical protein